MSWFTILIALWLVFVPSNRIKLFRSHLRKWIKYYEEPVKFCLSIEKLFAQSKLGKLHNYNWKWWLNHEYLGTYYGFDCLSSTSERFRLDALFCWFSHLKKNGSNLNFASETFFHHRITVPTFESPQKVQWTVLSIFYAWDSSQQCQGIVKMFSWGLDEKGWCLQKPRLVK